MQVLACVARGKIAIGHRPSKFWLEPNCALDRSDGPKPATAPVRRRRIPRCQSSVRSRCVARIDAPPNTVASRIKGSRCTCQLVRILPSSSSRCRDPAGRSEVAENGWLLTRSTLTLTLSQRERGLCFIVLPVRFSSPAGRFGSSDRSGATAGRRRRRNASRTRWRPGPGSCPRASWRL